MYKTIKSNSDGEGEVPEISDDMHLAIPLRNIIAMIAFTAVATMSYFGIMERINVLEHDVEIQSMQIEQNSEFRVKWPRGELGSLPADARQDMMIEGLQRNVEELRDMQERIHELTIQIGTIERVIEITEE